MRWAVAREWLRTWRERPPLEELLEGIATYVGTWRPPGERRVSSEDELVLFALVNGGLRG